MRISSVVALALVALAPYAAADVTNLLFADDAGSGTDAPELPSGRIVVQPATLYHGAIQGPHGGNTVDPWDLYAVHLLAGQTMDVWVRGTALVVSVRGDGNESYGGDVTTGPIAVLGVEFTAPADGRYHIDIFGEPQTYCFAYSIDGGPNGVPAPVGTLSCMSGLPPTIEG